MSDNGGHKERLVTREDAVNTDTNPHEPWPIEPLCCSLHYPHYPAADHLDREIPRLSPMDILAAEQELDRLLIEFEAAGGRGVELADRIDLLRERLYGVDDHGTTASLQFTIRAEVLVDVDPDAEQVTGITILPEQNGNIRMYAPWDDSGHRYSDELLDRCREVILAKDWPCLTDLPESVRWEG